MEGRLSSEHNRRFLDEELREFHKYIARQQNLERTDYMISDYFTSVEEYILYLRETMKLPGMDVPLNGGAQFRRLMYEVEVFTRFAGCVAKISPVEVINAFGIDSSCEKVITNLMM